MDILNFISWIKGKRRVTSFDPAKTLLALGLKDERRDDEYLACAISVNDFVTQIQPSFVGLYGLFSQTVSSTPATGTVPVSLIGSGQGTLTVPANAFKIGNSFRANFAGHISSVNNDTLRMIVKSGSVILADTGAITMPNINTRHWTMWIDFTIRATGSAGGASIASGGQFTYLKNASNAFEGTAFSIINSTTFDTTVINTLEVTAQWSSSNAGNTMYSEIFTLTKTY